MNVAPIRIVTSAVGLSLIVSIIGFGFSCTQKTKIDRRSPIIGEEQKPKINNSQNQTKDDPGTPGKPGDAVNASVEINPIKSGPENLAKGRSLYQSQCISCHSSLNQGEILKFKLSCQTCSNFDDFVNIVVTTMPLGKVGSCDRDCARAIGAYLFTPL